MVGRTKYAVLDKAFLPKMIEQCVDDVDRGLIYTLYFTGMHGSLLESISEKNLIRHGDKHYLEWSRTKSKRTMNTQVPKVKIPQIEAFLKSKKKTMRHYNYLLKAIGEGAGFEGLSTMTFRHSRCVRMLRDEKRPVTEVAQEMGCTIDVVTRNYAKMRNDQLASEHDLDEEYAE